MYRGDLRSVCARRLRSGAMGSLATAAARERGERLWEGFSAAPPKSAVDSFQKLEAALKGVFDRLQGRMGVGLQARIRTTPADWALSRKVSIAFHSSGRRFRFWNDLRAGEQICDFNLVPAAHPSLRPGFEQGGTVLISASSYEACGGRPFRVIRSVCPPFAEYFSRPGRANPSWGSWYDLSDPFVVRGQAFSIEIAPTFVDRLPELESDLERLLPAALRLETAWVAVSGGFWAPYKRLVPTEELPRSRGTGTEVAWGWLHLAARGEVEGAHVPYWFHEEGWLRALAPAVRQATPNLARFLPAGC